MFWGPRIDSTEVQSEDVFDHYSLKLLLEPTPGRPHIKIELNGSWRDFCIVSRLVKVQLRPVSNPSAIYGLPGLYLSLLHL
jgi:hypothetical protein